MAVSINHLTSNVTLQVTQPYLVVDDEGLKAFAVGIQGPPSGSTVALAGLTDVDDAAVPTNRFFVVGDGAKFVTRGILGDDLPTIPLVKLVGLNTSNLASNAGILSDQIAGLDAGKITGTFPLSLLNQGTTGQFLRGDGAYSNTLTGGLTIAGALAGATTGSFSGAVATGALTVTGDMAATGAVSGTTGTFSSNVTLSATNGLILRPANTGYNAFCGGSTESSASGAYIRCFGASEGSYPGQIWLAPSLNKGVALYDGAFARQAYVYHAGVLLGGACKIIYSSSGTTTAANNEIVGAVGGLRYNVASGLGHVFAVANTTSLQVIAGETLVTGYLTLWSTAGTIRRSVNSDELRICGGVDANVNLGPFLQLFGNTKATNPGIIRYYPGNAAGARHEFYDNAAALRGIFSENGLTVTGGRRVKTSTKTTTYTATASDYALICNHATVAFTINLPAATGSGQVLFVKNIGAANVTVDANASETIDGALTQVLTTGNRIQIVDYATGLWAAI